MTMYLRVYAKLSKLHFKVLLISNCGEKLLKICFKLVPFFSTFYALLLAFGEQR